MVELGPFTKYFFPFRLPRYSSDDLNRLSIKKSSSSSPNGTKPLPMNTPDIEIPPADQDDDEESLTAAQKINHKLRNIDFNGLISGIMYRMRKVFWSHSSVHCKSF